MRSQIQSGEKTCSMYDGHCEVDFGEIDVVSVLCQ